MCLLFVRTYGGVLLPDMASLPDTATWDLHELEPTTMYTRLPHQTDYKYVHCPGDCIPTLCSLYERRSLALQAFAHPARD